MEASPKEQIRTLLIQLREQNVEARVSLDEFADGPAFTVLVRRDGQESFEEAVVASRPVAVQLLRGVLLGLRVDQSGGPGRG